MAAPFLGIPEELKDMVLEDLSAQDLLSMSLAQREFTLQATAKRWREVTPAGYETLMNHQKIAPENQQRFVDNIEKLQFHAHRHDPQTELRLPELDTTHLKFHKLQSLYISHPDRSEPGPNLKISHFINPRLTALRTEGGLATPTHVLTPDNFLPKLVECPKLRQLELGREIQGATPAQLQYLLGQLINLQRVGFTNGASSLVGEATVVQLAAMPSITSLTLDINIGTQIVQAIKDAAHRPFQNLKAATLRITPVALPNLVPILTKVDHFNLKIINPSPGDPFDALRFMPNLRKLYITMTTAHLLTARMLLSLSTINLTHFSLQAKQGLDIDILHGADEMFFEDHPNLEYLRLDWNVEGKDGFPTLKAIGRYCRRLKELNLRLDWPPFVFATPRPSEDDEDEMEIDGMGQVLFPELEKLTLSMVETRDGPESGPHPLEMDVNVDATCPGAWDIHDMLRYHCPKLQELVSGSMDGHDDYWIDDSVRCLIAYSRPQL